MTRAVVVTGGGRYADVWHDCAGTSAEVARVLDARGVTTRVSGRPRDLLDPVPDGVPAAERDGIVTLADADLLVVNAAGSGTGHDAPSDDDADWVEFHDAVWQHVAAGRPVLALHSSTITFRDSPTWGSVVGARWRHGTTMHPEIGRTDVQVDPGAHPLAAGLETFSVYDERYTWLELDESLGAVVPYATHEHDGQTHPLAWAREVGERGARVVYDALGHGVASYASPGRRALLEAELDWLLEGRTS